MDLSRDFNATTDNLGGDVQGLEEGGLTGVTTGRASGDEDIAGSQHTRTRSGRHLVRDEQIANLLQVVIRENETDIRLEKNIIINSPYCVEI